ncbi:MAG TPA: amidohydrolase family protein [Spongiibacteraceae bacterium]|jgi:predicted TIM-barrel fold metal-dependent hydrolase|nr:amidohydrolase family protein [Spongiibacteraceae bacterium]HUH38892.1 amidohydrolase family protein [Spongiibacteraceae bacterium]
MSNEPYVLITADTHAGGSHAQYREYLEPQYREAFDVWRGGYKNPSQAHYGGKKLRNWDSEVRNTDQDGQGVVGEVIYPNTVPPFYRKSIVTAPPPRPEDYEHCLAGTRAHNRWLADFCADDPVRRAGIGLIQPHDIDEAIKDVEWIARHNLRGGVLLPLIPDDCTWLKPLYHPDYDRLFAAIQDHDLVMNHHSGQGLPSYDDTAVGQALWISEVPFFSKRGYAHLLMSGVYEKFPRLKYILTESGCSWAPEMLAMLDRIHYGIKAGAIGEMDYSKTDWILKEPPSFYARRNCWYGASFPSLAELNGRHEIGVDKICWGNDYPHYEGTFPYNLESLQLTFKDVPENERRMMFGENAAKLYGFDMEKLRERARAVGPTPAQVDAPLEKIPDDSQCYLFVNARMAQAG